MKPLIIIVYAALFGFLFFSCFQQTNVWDKGGEKKDDTPPTIVSASTTNNTHIEVVFNEEVEEQSAETVENYKIAGLTISGAVKDAADFTKVILTTSSQQNVTYTVIAANVKDKFLNVIGNTQNTGSFSGDPLPEVDTAFAINNTTIAVFFSESITMLSAQNAVYTIVDQYGYEFSPVSFLSFNPPREVLLSTDNQFDGTYTLTVSGVQDLTGNSIDAWNSIDPARKTGDFYGDPIPTITSVRAINNTYVKIIFSENVIGADSLSNYSIIDAGAPNGGFFNNIPPITLNEVYIQTDDQVLVTDNYSLTVANIEDNNGNPIDSSPTYNFTGNKIKIITGLQIQIQFSSPVDPTSSQNILNYICPGLTISSALRGASPADYDKVTLSLNPSTPLSFYSPYSLSISGVSDESLNPIPDESVDFETGPTIP